MLKITINREDLKNYKSKDCNPEIFNKTNIEIKDATSICKLLYRMIHFNEEMNMI
jgi:hypothetical protein